MNRKLKPVIAILVFLCISLGALSCISATNDTSVISSGTSSNSNTTSVSVANTTTDNTNNLLSSSASNTLQATTNSTSDQISQTDISTNKSAISTETNSNALLSTTQNSDDNNSIQSDSNIVSDNNNTINTNTGLLTSQVNGSSNNSIISESNNASVSIISKNNSNIISNNFTENYGDGKNYTVRLVDDNGNPIIGQHISLNLTRLSDNASKVYYATTDTDGYAYLPINLAVGNYTVTTSYSGNYNYNSSKNKYNTITVNTTTGKLDPILIANNFTEVYGDAHNFTIRLVDDDGNPIIGQHIALNLTKISNGASKIYWVTTDTAGYAYLEINLAPGYYNVSGSYSGSSVYEGASTVYNTITVTSPTNASTNNNTNKQNTSSNKSGYVSISDIVSKANDVFSFVTNNQRLPNYVTINGQTYTMAQFAYLVSAALIQINNGVYDDIQVLNVTQQANVTSSSITGTLSISDVISMASRINTYITSNLVTPKYDSSNGLGKLTFENYLLVFCQALAQYGDAGSLPSTVSVNTSAFSSTSSSSNSSSGGSSSGITTTTTGSGINDLNTISDLSAYLAAYTHCEVNSAKIQALAASLTSGLTTTWAKATAIYNYVRDKISYTYYSNSKYGAAGTLSAGTGNCVDQASLVIALCRAAGIPARYVHGSGCKFTSGLNAGHVWAQILVDGVWYAADPTSIRNSLGVIKNWNTASFTLKSISASISF